MASRDNVHRVIQPHFSSGEVSPEISTRVDNQYHQATLRACTNGYPSERGAVSKRGGSHYAWTTTFHTRKTRLFPHIATSNIVNYLEIIDVGIFVRDSNYQIREYTRAWEVSNDVTPIDANAWALNFTYVRSTFTMVLANAEVPPNGTCVRFTAVGAGTLPPALSAGTDYFLGVRVAGAPTDLKRAVTEITIHTSFLDADTDTARVDLSGGSGMMIMESFLSGSGGTQRSPLILPVYYAEDDIDDVRISTNEDTLYLFHEDYPVVRIFRSSTNQYTLYRPDMIFGPWDEFQEFPGITACEAFVAGGRPDHIHSSAATEFGFDWTRTPEFAAAPANRMGLFTNDDIGKLLLIPSDANVGDAWDGTGFIIIQIIDVEGYVTTALPAPYDNVLGDNGKWTGGEMRIEAVFTGGDATGVGDLIKGYGWRLGHFYNDTNGWPRHGAFNEDRLLMTGGGLSSNTINGSAPGSFAYFAPYDESLNVDGGGIKFTPISDKNEYDAINFMVTFRDFLFGSAAGLWKVQTGLTSVEKTNARGSAFLDAVTIEDFAFFAGAGADRLHGVRFSERTQGYDLIDFSAFAEHIVNIGIREMVVAEEPDPVIYLRLADGTLGVFHFNPAYELQAWSRYITSGVIESIAVAPTPGNTHSRLYMVVQRWTELVTDQPVYERIVEYLEESWDSDQVETEAFFVDSGVTVVAEGSSPVIEPGGAIEGVRLLAVDLGDGDLLALELDAAYLGVDGQEDVYIEEVEGPIGVWMNSRSWKVHRPVGQPDTLAFLQTRDGEYIPIAKTDHWAAITQMKLYELGTTFTVSLQNLVGREVMALADGEIIGPFDVEILGLGSVTLDGPIGLLHIGLPYDYRVKPQPPELALTSSVTYGAKRSINNVMLSLDRSLGGKVRLLGDDSEEPGEYEDIVTRRVRDIHGVTSQFFTGNVDVQPQGGYMNDQHVEIFHDEPAPITVRAVVYEVDFQLKGRTS